MLRVVLFQTVSRSWYVHEFGQNRERVCRLSGLRQRRRSDCLPRLRAVITEVAERTAASFEFAKALKSRAALRLSMIRSVPERG